MGCQKPTKNNWLWGLYYQRPTRTIFSLLNGWTRNWSSCRLISIYSNWYFWFHKRDSRVEDQQGWNLGFVWCLLVIHKRAFGRNNRDPGQQSLFEQLVQYNAQSCPYQNGSCRSPKRSHQRPTVSVRRSSLWTDRWRCYGVPSVSALNSKRLHVIHRKYPWATRTTSILLPSICCLHAHCNGRFSNSNYFPAYPQQCPHFGQIHHEGGKTILLLLDNGVMKTPKRLFLSLIFACNIFLSQKINVASEYEGKLKRRGLNRIPLLKYCCADAKRRRIPIMMVVNWIEIFKKLLDIWAHKLISIQHVICTLGGDLTPDF